jgi:hypothetical protein
LKFVEKRVATTLTLSAETRTAGGVNFEGINEIRAAINMCPEWGEEESLQRNDQPD